MFDLLLDSCECCRESCSLTTMKVIMLLILNLKMKRTETHRHIFSIYGTLHTLLHSNMCRKMCLVLVSAAVPRPLSSLLSLQAVCVPGLGLRPEYRVTVLYSFLQLPSCCHPPILHPILNVSAPTQIKWINTREANHENFNIKQQKKEKSGLLNCSSLP